jgi:hypothetical protein
MGEGTGKVTKFEMLHFPPRFDSSQLINYDRSFPYQDLFPSLLLTQPEIFLLYTHVTKLLYVAEERQEICLRDAETFSGHSRAADS